VTQFRPPYPFPRDLAVDPLDRSHPPRPPPILAALTLVTLLWAGCTRPVEPVAPPSIPSAEKVRFKTDWYPEAEDGGFYQAVAQPIYRRHGLDVEIIPGGPGATAPQTMAAGRADLAMGRSDDVMVAISSGLPFLIVAAYFQHDPQGVLVHADSPVHTFADLNGRSVMAESGGNWVRYVKSHYHIEFGLIPTNYGIAMFMADPNFIQQCFVTNEPYYVQINGGHARALLLSDTGFDPYRVIYTTQRFAREHPAAVRAFVAASLEGWQDYLHGDPTPANGAIAQHNANMTLGNLRYSRDALNSLHIAEGHPEAGERLGVMQRERFQRQVEQLVELKLIPHALSLTQVVSFDFLPPELQAASN
jgi:NitT/TauT family transport system substrate-binding protein